MIWILLATFAAFILYGGIQMARGAILTPVQIINLARNAGFSGDDLVIAAAVAYAESAGNPMAYNPETAAGAPQDKGSYGLWQIFLHAHPEFEGWNLYDPQTNALAAFKVYQGAGNSFNPWATFTGNAYQAYLTQAQQGISA